MSTTALERIGCGFCFHTLDSESGEGVRGGVAACGRCGRLYHKDCLPDRCANPACMLDDFVVSSFEEELRPVALDARPLQPVVVFSSEPDPSSTTLGNIPTAVTWASMGILALAALTVPIPTLMVFLLGPLLIMLHRELRYPGLARSSYKRLCALRVRRGFDGYRKLEPTSMVEAGLLVLFLILNAGFALAVYGAAALAMGLWSLGVLFWPTETLKAWLQTYSVQPIDKMKSWSAVLVVNYVLSIISVGVALFMILETVGPVFPIWSYAILLAVGLAAWAAGWLGLHVASREPERLARLTFASFTLALLLAILLAAIIEGQRLRGHFLSFDSTWDLVGPAVVVAVILALRFYAYRQETNASAKMRPSWGIAAFLMVGLTLSAPAAIGIEDHPILRSLLLIAIAVIAAPSVKLFLMFVSAGPDGNIPEWASLYLMITVGSILTSFFTLFGGAVGLLISVMLFIVLWRVRTNAVVVPA
jgi:hypothetical protein